MTLAKRRTISTKPKDSPGAARQCRAGFTLIELVIAMSMVAILAMSLYASLRTAFHAQASAENALEPSRTAELAIQFLREDLQDAVPPTGILAGAFIGTAGQDDRGRASDSLKFFATAPARQHASGNGEIKQIELLVTTLDNETDRVLVRRVTPNLLSPSTPDPDQEILCRGVSGFSLRYFDGGDWVPSWDSTTVDNVLPAAVEVTVELDRPDGATGLRTLRYTRVVPIPCATTASTDSTTGGTP